MPTTESNEAFSNLAAARSRLIKLTRLLNRAHTQRYDNRAARDRYIQAQREWDAAFRLFTAAAEEFSVTVKKLQGDVEAGLVPVDRSEVETLSSSGR